MVRVALLFLVAAAFAILVLSNLSPLTLTILGTKTLALPLGVWVAGAIAAGALTTVILAGLLRLARPVAAPASARRPSPRKADRVTSDSFRPWSARATRQPSQSTTTASYTNTRTEQQTSQPSSATWDDWNNEPLTDRKPETQTSVRDTEDDDWANWEGYEDSERQPSSRHDSQEDLDNDFSNNQRDDRSYSESARPTDFEVKREPETRYQSGSVYSFSYRRAEDNEPEPTKPTAKPGEVYDADYRVITPPYRPDPEEVMRPPDRATEVRDSGFDDDSDFDTDEFEQDRVGQDKEVADGRNDDDDEWGIDDWGVIEEPEDRGDRPRR